MKKQMKKQLASMAIPPDVVGLTKASTTKTTIKSQSKIKKTNKKGR